MRENPNREKRDIDTFFLNHDKVCHHHPQNILWVKGIGTHPYSLPTFVSQYPLENRLNPIGVGDGIAFLLVDFEELLFESTLACISFLLSYHQIHIQHKPFPHRQSNPRPQ